MDDHSNFNSSPFLLTFILVPSLKAPEKPREISDGENSLRDAEKILEEIAVEFERDPSLEELAEHMDMSSYELAETLKTSVFFCEI